jgi:hypothetical protein
MKSLRVQVERVVRPIRASHLRKDRMREELLAHLIRLFDEELARTNDAQSATSEAIRRFGDASSLARELQASVPWLERWGFFSFPNSGPIRRRPVESPVRYIMRMNCWAGAFGIAFYASLAFVIIIAGNQRARQIDQPPASQLLAYCMGLAAIQFAGLIGLGLLSEGIRQELENHAVSESTVERRRATWRIVCYTVTGSVVWGCSFAGTLLLVEFAFIPFISRAQFWCITLGATALGMPLTLRQAWHWKALTRRFENWDSLDLDEQPSA